MNKEKALEKIKKCLALSKSSNEHEAAQALKHAYALMKQFNIDLEEIEKSKLSISTGDIKGSMTVWHTLLITAISKAFTTVPILTGTSIKWHGHGLNSELAEYTYQVLFRLCNQARTHYLKTHLKNVKKKSHKTLRANIYAEAWCQAIIKVIDQFISKEDEAKYEEILAIVTKDTIVCKPRDRNRLKNADSHIKISANGDYSKGYDDGKKIKLHRPIYNNSVLMIE